MRLSKDFLIHAVFLSPSHSIRIHSFLLSGLFFCDVMLLRVHQLVYQATGQHDVVLDARCTCLKRTLSNKLSMNFTVLHKCAFEHGNLQKKNTSLQYVGAFDYKSHLPSTKHREQSQNKNDGIFKVYISCSLLRTVAYKYMYLKTNREKCWGLVLLHVQQQKENIEHHWRYRYDNSNWPEC